MGLIKGKNGAIKYGGTKIGRMKNIEISVDKDTKDVTTFDSNGWKEFLATLKSWSVSCDGEFDGANAVQKAILLDITGDDDEIEVIIELASGISLTGNVIVTNATIPVEVGGSAEVSYEMQGTGELTPTLPS